MIFFSIKLFPLPDEKAECVENQGKKVGAIVYQNKTAGIIFIPAVKDW
jgi:hypothetical protein